MSDFSRQEWDVIVVGAGSSGAVLAARLSQNPACRVLLLEAGPDHPDAATLPAPLRDAHAPVLQGWNWDFNAHPRPLASLHSLQGLMGSARVIAAAPRDAWAAAKAVVHAPRPAGGPLHTFPYMLGKVVGGSSAVNGAIALRPPGEDFEPWLAHGGSAWDWQHLLPAFCALETDHDCSGPLHGQAGPVPIRRPPPDALSPPQAAFRSACLAQGHAALDDLNAASQAGVGLLPSNAVQGQRISTAQAYLDPARPRSNLQIVGGCLVHRVLFDGQRASGVELAHAGQVLRLRAGSVVLSAGAINTPALLLRSGIGDQRACQALGVVPLLHRPGVGENLMDHPALMFWMLPRCLDRGAPRSAQHQVMLRAASRAGLLPDLNLFFLSGFQTAAIPMLAGMLQSPVAHALSVVLSRPRSRGRVWLADADPASAPVIELNLAAEAIDLERLMSGARMAWTLAHSAPIQALTRSIFMWNDSIMGSDSLLRNAILRMVNGTWHAAGTARMGRADDALAVVDGQCRVHGVPNLRVVDASVMPVIPSTPTNLTCIMLAERVAALMRD